MNPIELDIKRIDIDIHIYIYTQFLKPTIIIVSLFLLKERHLFSSRVKPVAGHPDHLHSADADDGVLRGAWRHDFDVSTGWAHGGLNDRALGIIGLFEGNHFQVSEIRYFTQNPF